MGGEKVMTSICTRCWTSCDVDELEMDLFEEEWGEPLSIQGSLCCHADTIFVDEEELDDIVNDIQNNCFTFDQAFEKHGKIAYYVAENFVFLPGYEE